MKHWLLLCDPEVYTIDRLLKQAAKTVTWDSDFSRLTNEELAKMQPRDRVLLVCVAGESITVTGELQVCKKPEPDPRQDDPSSKYFRSPEESRVFVQVPLKYSRKFTSAVSWAPLVASSNPKLAGLPDLSRFPYQSVFPIEERHHRAILMLQRSPESESTLRGDSAEDSPQFQRGSVAAPVIYPEDLQLDTVLGSGQFGKVYRATFRYQSVAVKVLDVKPDCLSERELASVKMEVDILQNTHCPHIIKFYGACITPDSISIVTELLDKGELGQLLEDRHVPLDLFMQLRMAWDIAVGMNWLHSSKPVQFLHRDLKPSNLLVDDNMRIKICDFGFCQLKDPQSNKLATSNKQVGTLMYMAPELLRNEDFSEKIDVYSFGLILWEIMTREKLFPELGPKDGARLKSMILSGQRPPLPDSIPYPLQRLIQKCWHDSPEQRPSFYEVAAELMDILYEEMISDPLGRDFWRGLQMHGVSEVRWDVFEAKLREEISEAYEAQLVDLPPRPTEEQVRAASDFQLSFFIASSGAKSNAPIKNELIRRYGPEAVSDSYEDQLDVELDCLRRLLAPNQAEKVCIKDWGNLLRWFGPFLDEANGFPTFLQRVKRTLRLPYFYGVYSENDAQNTLRYCDPLTFLLRFSGKPGYFSVSTVKDGKVGHRRILYSDAQFHSRKECFFSIEAVIASFRQARIIGQPARSTIFSDLFHQSVSRGYLCDSTELEEGQDFMMEDE